MEASPEYNPWFRSDDEIAEDVASKLGEDSRVDDIDIDVDVVNGVVKLSGTAESAEEAEMAESIAQIVDGVIDVVNDLYVLKSSHTQAPWPGADVKEEAELEDVEVIPGDREATENYIDAVDQGFSYIPPDEPEFPTERDSPNALRRREVAEQRFRRRRRPRKRGTDKVEGQEL
ncbi:MAG: BON domain-containing protein [Actinobacteria bacterium]|nr:BON domain-containing protein [Actinomycetota bacterium]